LPRFAANLTLLFTELPMMERFSAAASAGFRAVELLFPYDLAGPAVSQTLAINDLTLALINGPPPNYTDRPRGFAAVPGGQALFQQDFRRAARVARALGARHLHLMAGAAQGPEALRTYVENLAWATAQTPALSLTIEPMNAADMPGYFLTDFGLAAEVIARVGAPNLKLQFDAYHAHRITGDVAGTWAAVRAHVGHVQIAGCPDRHEPDSGEIDYPAFFDIIDADGYQGWVGAEYTPRKATDQGLAWARGLRHRG
jgi:hydroxypyruvate isomerase